MNKKVLIATTCALLSTSVFATRARMQGLGQDSDKGSHFIDDTRNVWRNAAHVNSMNNYVAIEKGNIDTVSAGVAIAEGGFFKEMGSFNYGVWLNGTNDHQNTQRNTDNSNLLANDNNIDLFFGGDAGMEWGVHINYASNEDEQTAAFVKDQSALGVGLGIAMGNLEVYANMGLKDESNGGTVVGDKWESDGTMQFGVNYGLGDWTVFFDSDTVGSKYTASGATATEASTKTMELGAGHTHEFSSKARMFTSVTYTSSTMETNNGTTVTETKTTTLPFLIGLEADANDWLTLRGSISQPILINGTENNAGQNLTGADAATVTFGMTFNYGKLKLDAAIGSSTNAGGNSSDLTIGTHYWF